MTIKIQGKNFVTVLSGEDVRKEVEAKILEENFGEINEDEVLSPNWKTK